MQVVPVIAAGLTASFAAKRAERIAASARLTRRKGVASAVEVTPTMRNRVERRIVMALSVYQANLKAENGNVMAKDWIFLVNVSRNQKPAWWKECKSRQKKIEGV
jgi:hypothetical protein